jgi:EAL domain-containing protein (putative c-di-GMP-specific phosphodiesterase class I)
MDSLALVRELGVDYVQGFRVGRPAPTTTTDVAPLRR